MLLFLLFHFKYIVDFLSNFKLIYDFLVSKKNDWKLFISTNCNEGKVPFLGKQILRCLPEAKFFFYRGAEERGAQELPLPQAACENTKKNCNLFVEGTGRACFAFLILWNDTETMF